MLDEELVQKKDDSTFLQRSILNVFLGRSSCLKSGLFSPRFADVWTEHFQKFKGTMNFVDMQAMYGVEACQGRLDRLATDLLGISKPSSGPGGGGGEGGRGGSASFYNNSNYNGEDEADEDPIDNPSRNGGRSSTNWHELWKYDQRFRTIEDTNRTALNRQLLENADEKVDYSPIQGKTHTNYEKER